MEPDQTKRTIKKEVLEIVLEDFTREQQQHNQVISDLVTVINGLTTKLEKSENSAGVQQPTTDNAAIIKSVQSAITQAVAGLQKPEQEERKQESKKIQILLFPEQDAKLFYKIVFSRWLVWLTVMLCINNLYKWAIHSTERQQAVRIELLRQERLRNAWGYLYDSSNKAVKKSMEKAYQKSVLQEQKEYQNTR
ncbi:hypothetical protein [Mucilaginibacter defluvii]|uniref:Uncharacterized protein n=1 Tax=Mucilaginibacter defluvii TaxID=1196019 RepID=A0ABP9G670_9SPHI